MKVAVVGPRQGADTDAAIQFCKELYERDPTIILCSGGARGVDQVSEMTWYQLGGRVWSWRAKKWGEERWGVERWEYGGTEPPLRKKLELEPTWREAKDALFYRSILVAEAADEIVAFFGQSAMRGTEFTVWISNYAYDKPTHVYQDGAWR